MTVENYVATVLIYLPAGAILVENGFICPEDCARQTLSSILLGSSYSGQDNLDK